MKDNMLLSSIKNKHRDIVIIHSERKHKILILQNAYL